MGGTTDHRKPRPQPAIRRAPRLHCAFPSPASIGIPFGSGSVGRQWLADAGIDDTEVSESHLRFDRPRGGAAIVADDGSRNGTYVNGARLRNEPLTLADGAVIRLGRTLLVYRASAPEMLSPASDESLAGPYGLEPLRTWIRSLRGSAIKNALLYGETGTGKEAAARLVAEALGRGHKYVPVSIADINPSTFESQLFGHVKGSFSGASNDQPGVFVANDRGALLLDELGEMPPLLQPKLLRALENGEVVPVGASRPRKVDVVVIGATNRDLQAMVKEGAFRADLLARFRAEFRLPPLRSRQEDIFFIAQAVSRAAGWEIDPADTEIEIEAVERLLLHPWPTNVRQLDKALSTARLHDETAGGLTLWAVDKALGPGPELPQALTVETLTAALKKADGNVSEATRLLGSTRGSVVRARKKWGLS